MTKGNIFFTSVFLAVSGSCAIGQTPGFYGLGTALGGTSGSSICLGVSPDGQAVVGRFKDIEYPYAEVGIVWTEGNGVTSLGDLPGDGFITEAEDASNAGQVIVGRATGPWNQYHAVYATPTAVIDIEEPNEYATRSSAYGVSGDGTVIVGFSEDPGVGTRAFRWSSVMGMTFLSGAHSTAFGVSTDGSTIVGINSSGAFRWTQETGTVTLGGFPNESGGGLAVDASADGSVVAGSSTRHLQGSTSEFTEACIWTESNGIVGLGSLADNPVKVLLSEAAAISGNGQVVVGQSCDDLGYEHPFIWDAQHGMRKLGDVLVQEYGLDLANWTRMRVKGMSDDGRTIVGYGYGPSGQREGWVAVIPEPATVSFLAMGGLALRRRRSRANTAARTLSRLLTRPKGSV